MRSKNLGEGGIASRPSERNQASYSSLEAGLPGPPEKKEKRNCQHPSRMWETSIERRENSEKKREKGDPHLSPRGKKYHCLINTLGRGREKVLPRDRCARRETRRRERRKKKRIPNLLIKKIPSIDMCREEGES